MPNPPPNGPASPLSAFLRPLHLGVLGAGGVPDARRSQITNVPSVALFSAGAGGMDRPAAAVSFAKARYECR